MLDFKEVLVPEVSREKEKTLLKINGNISSKDTTGKNYDFSSIFKNYASISYVVDGKSYYETSDFNFVFSTKSSETNSYYVEVDKDILNASFIKVTFNFRDSRYSYVLRGDVSE